MFHTFRESNTERFSIQWWMKSGSGWTKSNFSSDLLRLREILKKLRGWKRLEHLKWCPYSPWMFYIYIIYIYAIFTYIWGWKDLRGGDNLHLSPCESGDRLILRNIIYMTRIYVCIYIYNEDFTKTKSRNIKKLYVQHIWHVCIG